MGLSIYESQKKKWMLEPRNPDGSLNAKVYGTLPELQSMLPCATEDQLFAHYFSMNKGVESIGWPEMRDWYLKTYNHIIREKTW